MSARARPRPLQRLHRARDVDRVAEASIDVDDHRDIDRIAHRRHMVGQLRRRDEADIRHAEEGVGDARPCDEEGIEPELLDHACRECVGGTGDEQARAALELAAQNAIG
jgi:hypothetical protein